MSTSTQNPVTFQMPAGNVDVSASFTASTTCTYPVTVNSSPSCILQAFQQSGYWSLLSPEQQAAAQSDPAGWLANHPYLYDAYPQYFAQATSTTSTTTPPSSTTSTTSACTFPVTVNSPPSCILQAYYDSGYWNLIDAQHQQWAESDPVGYLQAHPYLYSAYPQYFAQA